MGVSSVLAAVWVGGGWVGGGWASGDSASEVRGVSMVAVGVGMSVVAGLSRLSVRVSGGVVSSSSMEGSDHALSNTLLLIIIILVSISVWEDLYWPRERFCIVEEVLFHV